MATQRTLKLNLLADVDKFGKGLTTAGNDAKSFGSKVSKYGKIAAGAFAAVAAAAGAMAIKLGVDAVQGAVEDEISQKKLATALRNTTGATDEQIAATEDYIKATQLRYGVSDVKLRDSLGILTRFTKDTTEAQKLNNLAVDISAATGKNLEGVATALGKAYDGNFTALRKLGVPLDENIVKTKDFDGLTKQLSDTFGGAAQANTETLAGKLAILKETFAEISEDIGVKLIPKLKLLLENVALVAKGFSGEDPEGLTARARELAGEYSGNGASSLGGALGALTDAFGALFAAITDDGDEATTTLEQFANSIESIANALDSLARNWGKVSGFWDKITTSPLTLLFPGANPNVKPKAGAAGASVMANQPIRVGEFGSELFIPSGSGSIRPDRGGGGNTFIFNGVIDGESARRSIERLMQQSTRRTGTVNLAGSQL
jgi:hypothetical protein